MAEECIVCGSEALLNVKTFLMEAMKRPPAEIEVAKVKLKEAVREALHAEQHLTSTHADLASEIREFRKSFETCMFSTDELAKCLPQNPIQTVESIIDKVVKRGLASVNVPRQ